MDLTVVSVIIAVVGIVLQVSNAFPEHQETRKVIVVLSLGVFVGVAISAALGATYNVTGNVDRRFALLYGLAGAGAFFALLAILIKDDARQQMAAAAAFGTGVIFLIAGAVVAAGAGDRVPQYSTDEVLILANSAEQSRQFETAIDRLKELEQRLDSPEAREAIRVRIKKLKAMQAGIAN